VIETGHMTDHRRHGYLKRPDWQAGFVTLDVLGLGDIRAQKAVWEQDLGELRYGGKTYRALPSGLAVAA